METQLPSLCAGWLGAHIVIVDGLCCTDQKFLPLSCCRKATVTTVAVLERLLTPEEPSLGKTISFGSPGVLGAFRVSGRPENNAGVRTMAELGPLLFPFPRIPRHIFKMAF